MNPTFKKYLEIFIVLFILFTLIHFVLYKMYFDICIYNREHLVSNFSNKDSYGEIFSLLNKNINTLLI